jgi:hypothetical protein
MSRFADRPAITAPAVFFALGKLMRSSAPHAYVITRAKNGVVQLCIMDRHSEGFTVARSNLHPLDARLLAHRLLADADELDRGGRGG